MTTTSHTVSFTLNGEKKTFDTRPDEKLLTLLRREGYRGTKYGCGQGTCGACTVLVDGRAAYACLFYAMQAEGRKVRTIESAGTFEKPNEFQKELIAAGAVQCGYCIPGMILSAKAYLDEHPAPTEGEVREALAGNLCRCTGYQKITDAVLAAVRRLAAGRAPE